MAALVIDPGAFKRAGDFAASIGPCSSQGQASVPRQDGTGGKVRLGPISKRGNGYLRRLLVNGATAVLKSKRATEDPLLAKLLRAKPRKLVAVALANKMARIGWALMTRQEDFRGRSGKFARVNTRDGNAGQSGDRGQPASVIGALRPRRNDRDLDPRFPSGPAAVSCRDNRPDT
jgi:hypothetical protein